LRVKHVVSLGWVKMKKEYAEKRGRIDWLAEVLPEGRHMAQGGPGDRGDEGRVGRGRVNSQK